MTTPLPGLNPVKEVPGERPKSPLIVVAPTFVTPVALNTVKLVRFGGIIPRIPKMSENRIILEIELMGVLEYIGMV